LSGNWAWCAATSAPAGDSVRLSVCSTTSLSWDAHRKTPMAGVSCGLPAHIAVQRFQVEIQLAQVLRFERRDFELDGDQAGLAPRNVHSQWHHRAVGPAIGLDLVVQVLADVPVKIDHLSGGWRRVLATPQRAAQDIAGNAPDEDVELAVQELVHGAAFRISAGYVR
jgi:hypothetical protein